MKKKSNQRITKIKIDQVLRLLEKAEDTNVEDATVINPATDQLTTYPDMNNLRIWTRDNLTKGLNKIIFNKFDSDGQTYMTTLVDGLPLYTKMSKTLQGPTVTTIGLNSILEVTGSPDISSEFIYKTTTKTDYIQIPFNYIRVNSVLLLCFTLDSDFTQSTTQYMLSEFQNNPFSLQIKENSNDLCIWGNTDWETIIPSMTPGTTYYLKIIFNSLTNNNNKITTSYSTDGSSYSSATTHTVTTESSPTNQRGYTIGTTPVTTTTQLPFPGTFDLTKSLITSSNVTYNFVTEESKDTLIETSKPGLWLSNLVQPISGSTAGSWLRSNLINSNESSYNLTNSDTIGNYSNTFTQPALIMENNLNANKDSCEKIIYPTPAFLNNERAILYNQHFSPSSQGSTSYVNQPSNNARYGQPDNYFLYKFGSYQSIAFPKDPDVQIYTESDNSCLKYNFYSSHGKADFIIKAPNSKQTPQALRSLKFTPNTDSTGGTISGSLSSIDDNGTECIQNINYQFKSTQAIFNPNISHEYGEDNLGNINVNITKVKGTLQTCYYYIEYAEGKNINKPVSGLYIFSLNTRMSSNRKFNYWTYGSSSSDLSHQTTSSSYPNYAYFNYQTSTSRSTRPAANYDSNGYCGTTIGYISGYIMTSDSTFDTDQTDIPLYLHIKDLTEEYRDKIGHYINSDCFGNAYDIYVSTDETPKAYETVYPIFNSVNINKDGIISGLSEIDIPL